ncbi:hypothetical protein [Aphanothece stagnina]|uniref:hypothetical protein n=1 Tax=Aphanothece stagnina TaxID=1004305 RepID=UPI00398F719E
MPARPDLEGRLLGAVAEREAAQARRLADQLVHRRGVAALERLIHRTLSRSQGEEARDWLAGLVGLAAPVAAQSVDQWVDQVLDQVVAPRVEPFLQPEPADETDRSTPDSGAMAALQDTLGVGFAASEAFGEASWLQDLAREQDVLAGILREPVAPAASAPSPSAQQPLIPRLMAVSPSPVSRRAPAPTPASLARLRAWLHDDDVLPEAS